MNKKIVFFICTFVLVLAFPIIANAEFSVWDGESADPDWGSEYSSSTSSNKIFYINDADDFIAFRNKMVEFTDPYNENPFYSDTVILNCDIDLGNHNLRYGIGTWDPTNSNTNAWNKAHVFRGTFVGNGHVIKNITMDQTKPDAYYKDSNPNCAVGLFVTDYATLSDFGIENMTVILPSSDEYNRYAGGLTAISYRSTIENCYVKNLSFKGGWSSASSWARIGAISGFHRGGSISNVYVDGCDFTGINQGMIPAATCAGLSVSGENSPQISFSYTNNIKPSEATGGTYDSTVVCNKDDVVINSVYAEVVEHRGSGVTGTTGTLEDAYLDFNNTLGAGLGFVDLSERGIIPILTWEPVPPDFACGDVSFYANYGMPNERKITELTNDVVTVVIQNVKNLSGVDCEDIVVSAVCLNNKKMCAFDAEVFELANSNSYSTTLQLDLTEVELKEDAKIQLVAYKSQTNVVPLFDAYNLSK